MLDSRVEEKKMATPGSSRENDSASSDDSRSSDDDCDLESANSLDGFESEDEFDEYVDPGLLDKRIRHRVGD